MRTEVVHGSGIVEVKSECLLGMYLQAHARILFYSFSGKIPGIIF